MVVITLLASGLSATFSSVATAAPPSNDSWYSRESVAGAATGSTTGTTIEATTEAGREAAPDVGYPSVPRSVWYSLSPVDSSTQPYSSCEITVTGDSGFVPLLQAAGRTGIANSLSPTPEGPYVDDASGDSTTAQLTYVFPDPYDSEYSIAVAGFDSGSGATDGTFTLSWTCELAGGGGGGDEGGSIPSIDLDHYLGRAENSTLPNTL